MFRRGLSCKVLVERRKRIRDSTVVARAYVQFEVCISYSFPLCIES